MSVLDEYLLPNLSDLTAEFLSLEELIRLKIPIDDSVLRAKVGFYRVNLLMPPQDPKTDPRILSESEQDAVAAAVLLGAEIPGLPDHLAELSQFPPRLAKIVLKPALDHLTYPRLNGWIGKWPNPGLQLHRSSTKQIMKAALRQLPPYPGDALFWLASRLGSVSVARLMVKANPNLTKLMNILMFNHTFAEKVWVTLLDELTTTQIITGLGGIASRSSGEWRDLITLTLEQYDVFQVCPHPNILTVFLEKTSNPLPLLLESPRFDPANVMAYLMDSPLYVRWIQAMAWLFHQPAVRPHITKSNISELTARSRKLGRGQVTRFFEAFAQEFQ